MQPIQPSETSLRTTNPIRQIVDSMKLSPNPSKPTISLALGDPTTFGNFPLHPSIITHLTQLLTSSKHNGYGPSTGLLEARQAIAQSQSTPTSPLTADDVIITSGCSGALDLVITALCNPGDNILIPRPGFSLYQTLAESKGVECRWYDCIPEHNWEINLHNLRSLADNNTKFILINNPSNPCGSVFTRNHLQEIVDVARELALPIVSDEIYDTMVFEGEFVPIASISTDVPVIAVGGLAKKFLVPGWRVGWILLHDTPTPTLTQIKKASTRLSQLIIGANTLIQSAIPFMLTKTPTDFHNSNRSQLLLNASTSFDMISKIPGLKPIRPKGAMYLMVRVDTTVLNFKSDLDFVEKLYCQESVHCLPGECFKYGNYFRIVFTAPEGILREAYGRMKEFCARNQRN